MSKEVAEVAIYETNNSLKEIRVALTLRQLIDQNHILFTQPHPQIFFQVQLIDSRLTLLPPAFTALTNRSLEINETLQFPVNYRELDYDSFFAISLWSMDHSSKIPLASTRISVFKPNLTLRTGLLHLILWPDCAPDLSRQNLTPGLVDLKCMQVINQCSQFEQIMDKTEAKTSLDCRMIQISKTEQIYQYRAFPAAFIQVEFQNFDHLVIFRDPILYQFERNDFTVKDEGFDSCLVFYDHGYEQQVESPLKKIYFQQKRNILNPKLLHPNKVQQEKMFQLAKRPGFLEMSQEEKLIFFSYRYALLKEPDYLVKFVQAVNWESQKETTEALELMHNWKSPSVIDSLCLLSSSFSANKLYQQAVKGPIEAMSSIRNYAVKRLQTATSEQLEGVLLQLVQALKFQKEQGPLQELLIKRGLQYIHIANHLYWYLSVEADNSKVQKRQKADAATIETERLYSQIFKRFKSKLGDRKYGEMMVRQESLREQLGAINRLFKDPKNTHKTKEAKLTQFRKKLSALDMGQGIQYALDPQISLLRPIPEKCRVFSSAMAPFLLTFESCKGQIKFMYKNGDDLRQDQLVMQLFKYMDEVLKAVNQDYNLITYKILAFNRSEGFLQFVQNTITLQDVLDIEKITISGYLERLATDPSNPIYKRKAQSMSSAKSEEISSQARRVIDNNYIQSCAGYCALTYFIGVGDRHLQNLLFDNLGRLFHIDFGFIFGQDPKAFATPVKLSPQMVDAMKDTRLFKIRSNEAFIYLRKRSRDILTLVQLMRTAGLKDLTKESLNKMVARFKLERNQKQSEQEYLQILDRCQNAFIGNYVHERIHGLAIAVRK